MRNDASWGLEGVLIIVKIYSKNIAARTDIKGTDDCINDILYPSHSTFNQKINRV